MKNTWKDMVSAALVVLGGVVMFAKLQSYDWWLIGSWKGALGVLAGIGVALFIVNIQQLLEFDTVANFFQIVLWAATITVIISSLLVTTTKVEFISSGILIGLTWLLQLAQDMWDRVPTHHGTHYVASH